jgi:hypothetical protein
LIEDQIKITVLKKNDLLRSDHISSKQIMITTSISIGLLLQSYQSTKNKMINDLLKKYIKISDQDQIIKKIMILDQDHAKFDRRS